MVTAIALEETFVDGQGQNIWCGSNLTLPKIEEMLFCKNNCLNTPQCFMGAPDKTTRVERLEGTDSEFCIGNARVWGIYVLCM
jgi:hypothetical protein